MFLAANGPLSEFDRSPKLNDVGVDFGGWVVILLVIGLLMLIAVVVTMWIAHREVADGRGEPELNPHSPIDSDKRSGRKRNR